MKRENAMSLQRSVQAETLDHLAESDPRAVRSRADLRRINRIMGTRRIMLRALESLPVPGRVIELGAGDGTLMLRLATRLAKRWPGCELTLLDRQRLVAAETVAAYRRLGWQVNILNVDILDWLAGPQWTQRERYDLAVANLFIHHFDGRQLPALLEGIAARADAFFACEPRRAWLPLAASHLTGFVGANAVTRQDAVLSVHAGFADNELGALWPKSDPAWEISEYAAGLFSHCFLAARKAG